MAVRTGKANKFGANASLFPGREGDGSVDVEVVLAPEHMAALESQHAEHVIMVVQVLHERNNFANSRSIQINQRRYNVEEGMRSADPVVSAKVCERCCGAV